MQLLLQLLQLLSQLPLCLGCLGQSVILLYFQRSQLFYFTLQLLVLQLCAGNLCRCNSSPRRKDASLAVCWQASCLATTGKHHAMTAAGQ